LPPSILSYSRALFSVAKRKKKESWELEILAALLGAGALLIPVPWAVTLLALAAVCAKAASKLASSSSRKSFRLAERSRRYDFEQKTLAWPIPPQERADVVFSMKDRELRKAAELWAPADTEYYANKGAAGDERLFCNLIESAFYTQRQMGMMRSLRWRHFAGAVAGLVAVLIATIFVQPAEGAFLVLRMIALIVTALLALDLFGEARSFERGEIELHQIIDAIVAEMRRTPLAHDEGVRLMTEYNCVLADLPLIPDEVWNTNSPLLNAAWEAFRNGLPRQCSN
jgi:hypothetical protein